MLVAHTSALTIFTQHSSTAQKVKIELRPAFKLANQEVSDRNGKWPVFI